ncbi:MAG: DEAD/DEAH box helicase [Proteobacteria bacterium]|nr:MAG: DEAD/DEAH box helicase [Pseudomonadota bacterium]
MPSLLSDRLRTDTEARFEQDWLRQRCTAEDILERLQSQEGVILADQVGMGKTYVALAVAVSQILRTRKSGQVVIFVPAAVADKWVREWKKFSESLIKAGSAIRCVERPIRSGEEFLRALGEAPKQKKHIVIVTHTALTTTLKDTFVQLALLHHATRNVRNRSDLRQRIAKWSTGLDGLIRNSEFTTARVSTLLESPLSKWRDAWLQLTGQELQDNPIPHAFEAAVRKLSMQPLRDAVEALPKNHSDKIEARLKKARQILGEVTQATWKWLLSSIELDLPLLIVDEAHRLKNPRTLVGGLFARRSEDSSAGAFDGIFRRMLFLTATPFELGHSELIEVLSRLGAVRTMRPAPEPCLNDRLEALQSAMTDAQSTALALAEAWGRLSPEDLPSFDQWDVQALPPAGLAPFAREAWEHARLAVTARVAMHAALRPWVIRHERPRRRVYHAGAAIQAPGEVCGIAIPDDAALPFLLAARAQSIAVDAKRGRPLFAYGIASSYEAFTRLETGNADEGRDSDLPDDERPPSVAQAAVVCPAPDAVAWYRSEIDRALEDSDVRDRHPKVRATVDKAVQLWWAGHKCLVFCWFIRTGEAVERALVHRVNKLMLKHASVALNTTNDPDTLAELDRICERLFRRDSASFERLRERLSDALSESADQLPDVLDLVVEAALGHFRQARSCYLVRFTQLSGDMDDVTVWAGINGDNPAGVVLLDRWRLFAERLARARRQIVAADPMQERDSEFTRIHDAMLGTTTDDDHAGGRAGSRSPVRRAHGGTDRDVRERIIAQFNTPLSPEVLVASSVMGEGIDLHQECRFIIHHDMDWNPSVLEQRTGRVDRIGALAERESKEIEVYEPYLAGTHDEKMFRVVKDRAQWFDIVMGRAAGSDEDGTDLEERRLPLHDRIRAELAMNLRSPAKQAGRHDHPG